MLIGVLSLQGDFHEHLRSLAEHGLSGVEVRTVEDLKKVHALILPGGESTTMAKLLVSTGLDKAIKTRAKKGMPIWGTCAGAILLAKNVISSVPLETTLGLLDITIVRNSYGRQAESFEAKIKVKGAEYPVYFIRAPRITKVGRGVKVVARRNHDLVLVQQGKIFASTCHFELTNYNRFTNFYSQFLTFNNVQKNSSN